MSGKFCVKKKSGSMCFGFDSVADMRMAEALAVQTLMLTKQKGTVEICGPVFGCDTAFSWDGKRAKRVITWKGWTKLLGVFSVLGLTVVAVEKLKNDR